MVGKLLACDLKANGITVVMIHVSIQYVIIVPVRVMVLLAGIYADWYDEKCWLRQVLGLRGRCVYIFFAFPARVFYLIFSRWAFSSCWIYCKFHLQVDPWTNWHLLGTSWSKVGFSNEYTLIEWIESGSFFCKGHRRGWACSGEKSFYTIAAALVIVHE